MNVFYFIYYKKLYFLNNIIMIYCLNFLFTINHKMINSNLGIKIIFLLNRNIKFFIVNVAINLLLTILQGEFYKI
jgi:hypothetical protein